MKFKLKPNQILTHGLNHFGLTLAQFHALKAGEEVEINKPKNALSLMLEQVEDEDEKETNDGN
jgi:hypothetical protein